MKKSFVTFGVGGHAEFLEIARPSFQTFAKRHNYDYYEAQQIGHKRPPPWYKVQCLLEMLKSYDVAVFVGCDIVIVDGRLDIPLGNYDIPIEHQPWYQALVAHNTPQCGLVPNDDMWVCNQRMIPWLEEIWSRDKWMDHGWWEQAALLDVMGYANLPVEQFPIYQADPDNELYQYTMWLNNEWNVHIWDRPQPVHPRFQHATMWPNRVEIMRQWAKQAEDWMNEAD